MHGTINGTRLNRIIAIEHHPQDDGTAHEVVRVLSEPTLGDLETVIPRGAAVVLITANREITGRILEWRRHPDGYDITIETDGTWQDSYV